MAYEVSCIPMRSAERLRLAVLSLLRTVRGNFMCHFGIKCSSFSHMNSGTSQRSPCASTGYEAYTSVQNANTLVERTGLTCTVDGARAGRRTCLMLLLATCLGGAWTLEQPRGSCLNFYPTFRYMLGQIFASGGPNAVSWLRSCVYL